MPLAWTAPLRINDFSRSRESVGTACEVIYDPSDQQCGDNRGSHERFNQRPCLFVDGHAQPLSSRPEYWNDNLSAYAATTGAIVYVYDREVQHLMWFIDPHERPSE